MVKGNDLKSFWINLTKENMPNNLKMNYRQKWSNTSDALSRFKYHEAYGNLGISKKIQRFKTQT